eukprot:6000568-Heterocapsa_arctica.AAC.1
MGRILVLDDVSDCAAKGSADNTLGFPMPGEPCRFVCWDLDDQGVSPPGFHERVQIGRLAAMAASPPFHPAPMSDFLDVPRRRAAPVDGLFTSVGKPDVKILG